MLENYNGSVFSGSANYRVKTEKYHVDTFILPGQEEQLEDLLTSFRTQKLEREFIYRKDYFTEKRGEILVHIEWIEKLIELASPIVERPI